MGAVGKQFMSNTIKSAWLHKRRFWQDIRNYEQAKTATPYYRQYCIDSALSEWRMLKNCIQTAREMRG